MQMYILSCSYGLLGKIAISGGIVRRGKKRGYGNKKGKSLKLNYSYQHLSLLRKSLLSQYLTSITETSEWGQSFFTQLKLSAAIAVLASVPFKNVLFVKFLSNPTILI